MKHHSNKSVKVPIIPLPEYISLHHKYIKLYIDFFYIKRMPFMHTKSSNITFLASDSLVQGSHTRLSKNFTQWPTVTQQEVLTSAYTTVKINLKLSIYENISGLKVYIFAHKDTTSPSSKNHSNHQSRRSM